MTSHPQSAPMGEQELKPCPFCGGTDLTRGIFYAHGSSEKDDAVRCVPCGVNAPAKAWQARASASHGEYTPITVRASSGPAPNESVGADEYDDTDYQEGYADGQNDANGTSTDTFKAVVAWLQKRGKVRWEDQPEGISAEDIIEGLNDLLPAPPTSHASQKLGSDES